MEERIRERTSDKTERASVSSAWRKGTGQESLWLRMVKKTDIGQFHLYPHGIESTAA